MLSIHPTIVIRRPVFRAKIVEGDTGAFVMVTAEDSEDVLARSTLSFSIDEAEQLIQELRRAIEAHRSALSAALPV